METLQHKLILGDSRDMRHVPKDSVDLIVTSPPYWQLKNYGIKSQIGFGETYEQYINSLNLVWVECFRVLKPGCRMCINIGDQFARAAYYGRYKVVPIHSEIIRFCETLGMDYMGNIIWQKPTNMHASGGGKVMGSYPYPKGGILKVDFEYILIFKKLGKNETPSIETRDSSKLTEEEWHTYFTSHWNFGGDRQNKHIAVFPEELAYMLIRMYSFRGDVVLDPFMGSGTTALAALKTGRKAVGYELNPDFFYFYKDKVLSWFPLNIVGFQKIEDNAQVDLAGLYQRLPYIFTDIVRIQRDDKAAINSYGSVMGISQKNFDQLDEPPLFDCPQTQLNDRPTVLINHVKAQEYEKMMNSGITYVRIGEAKGSLTVTPGFAQLSYVLLHIAGDNPQLFKLNKKGAFQIWTRETLIERGFSPKTAPYYAVLHFKKENPIIFEKVPSLILRKGTYITRILSIDEFGVLSK